MATAKGKITTAAIVSGTRIMVRLHTTPEGETFAEPSETKKQNAIAFTVETISTEMETGHGRRSRRFYSFAGTADDGKTYTIRYSAPAQTFWLAPSPKEDDMPVTATKTRKPAAKPAPADAKPKPKTIRSGRGATVRTASDVKKSGGRPVADSKPKATASKAKDDGVDFSAKKVRDRIVSLKTKDGQSIKEIAETLGLPAEHRSWFRVSKVWREEADKRGLNRPRRNKK